MDARAPPLAGEPRARRARSAGHAGRLIGSIDALTIRAGQINSLILELAPVSPWAEPIGRLRCLRGIDTITAVTLCAEVGDFDRFERPAQLMSYLGLVPSEHTTGETRRQGHITQTGSSIARWVLIEAAWHYRRPPRLAVNLARRQQDQPAEAIAIAWRAQQRLHHLWRRLEQRKRRTIAAVAIARQLTGFCWAITRTHHNTP